jgi:hypothetical protein
MEQKSFAETKTCELVVAVLDSYAQIERKVECFQTLVVPDSSDWAGPQPQHWQPKHWKAYVVHYLQSKNLMTKMTSKKEENTQRDTLTHRTQRPEHGHPRQFVAVTSAKHAHWSYKLPLVMEGRLERDFQDIDTAILSLLVPASESMTHRLMLCDLAILLSLVVAAVPAI